MQRFTAVIEMAGRLQSSSVMRCPECHSLNQAAAAVCTTCGLVLLQKQAAVEAAQPVIAATMSLPMRRSEDYAGQKRRAADRELDSCKFCGGEIPAGSIRCRHCSEIVNDDFYRDRARRIRSRINYASWIAYLFGLAALLVLRPVGIVSIAGGLLLSILYYAIPAEPPAPAGSESRTKTVDFLKRQFRMERVHFPIPAMGKRKLVFVGTPLVAALIGYSANLLLLQEPMNDVLKKNSAFRGMEVSAHYKYWVVPGVVEYDLQGLTVHQTPIDVHTALLEFAKKVKAKRYSRVDLSYRGVTKFSIDGASFQRVGEEYAKQNFDYVLYDFPRLLHATDGKSINEPDKRDELLQFHRQWYGTDSMSRPVANGI